jgi:hypothetical protein
MTITIIVQNYDTFINSVILLPTVLFGVVQSFIFGNLIDIPWDAWDSHL